MKSRQTKRLGQSAEALAADFLISNGYEIITRNFYSAYGEIDLIAKAANLLVFVEVKARCSNLESALNSVSKAKQQKIINTASIFLSQNSNYELMPTRFDVISVIQKNDIKQLHHLPDAFR